MRLEQVTFRPQTARAVLGCRGEFQAVSSLPRGTSTYLQHTVHHTQLLRIGVPFLYSSISTVHPSQLLIFIILSKARSLSICEPPLRCRVPSRRHPVNFLPILASSPRGSSSSEDRPSQILKSFRGRPCPAFLQGPSPSWIWELALSRYASSVVRLPRHPQRQNSFGWRGSSAEAVFFRTFLSEPASRKPPWSL